MYVATSKQLKDYDKALLDLDYSIEELVNKASDALLIHTMKYKKLVIVCGPGNNGADGISLALKLLERKHEVKMYILGEIDHLSSANRFYLEQAKHYSLPTTFLDNDQAFELFEKEASEADVVVDAMFGFGLNSELRGLVKTTVEIINGLYDKEVVAVDIPTGLNPDTGIPYNICVCATKTITLTAFKLAFLNEESRMYTGEVILETLDTKDLREEMGFAKIINPNWIKYNLKPRLYYGYKGDYGYISHITGSDEYRGACLMASRASVYTGSGIVDVCSSDKVLDALATFNPECIMTRREELDINELNNKDALLLGSGLSLKKESFDLVLKIMKNVDTPMVIDGDGLNILSQNIELLENHLGPIILTPHIGEFKRFATFNNESEMVEKANEFAKKYNVVLVLKTANTIICDGSEMYRNLTANKAMATAGMGDVLAGIITSFVGQGYSLMNAALIGTFIHGLCGDELAEDTYTVIPTKLIELIPVKMAEIINQ